VGTTVNACPGELAAHSFCLVVAPQFSKYPAWRTLYSFRCYFCYKKSILSSILSIKFYVRIPIGSEITRVLAVGAFEGDQFEFFIKVKNLSG
jgi:hypothetical protein